MGRVRQRTSSQCSTRSPRCESASSAKQPRLAQKVVQPGLGSDGLVHGRLKLQPLLGAQLKTDTIGQGLVGGIDARIQKKLAHGLVVHTRGLLKQLLHGSTDAHIDALEFGMGHVGLPAVAMRAVRTRRHLVKHGGHPISLGCQDSKLDHRHDLPCAGLGAIQVNKATARHRLQGARQMTRRLKSGPARHGLRVKPDTKRLGQLEDSRKTWISLGTESPIQALAAESGIFGDL